MSIYITGSSRFTEPRVGFRAITGTFAPDDQAKNKLESVTYYKAVDLLCEGPIEGFCDATGKLVSGSGIFKCIYFDDVPVQVTTEESTPDYYNY